MNDILRAGVAVPKLKIADPTFNANLIREKIKDHAHWAIDTVWGIGYKFVTK